MNPDSTVHSQGSTISGEEQLLIDRLQLWRKLSAGHKRTLLAHVDTLKQTLEAMQLNQPLFKIEDIYSIALEARRIHQNNEVITNDELRYVSEFVDIMALHEEKSKWKPPSETVTPEEFNELRERVQKLREKRDSMLQQMSKSHGESKE